MHIDVELKVNFGKVVAWSLLFIGKTLTDQYFLFWEEMGWREGGGELSITKKKIVHMGIFFCVSK